jgi:hypothetical protein
MANTEKQRGMKHRQCDVLSSCDRLDYIDYLIYIKRKLTQQWRE